MRGAAEAVEEAAEEALRAAGMRVTGIAASRAASRTAERGGGGRTCCAHSRALISGWTRSASVMARPQSGYAGHAIDLRVIGSICEMSVSTPWKRSSDSRFSPVESGGRTCGEAREPARGAEKTKLLLVERGDA